MKNTKARAAKLLILIAALAMTYQSSCARKPAASPRFPAPEGAIRQDETDILKDRSQWLRSQRTYPFGSIPAGARRKAFEAMKSMQGVAPQDSSLGWDPIGPQPTDSTFPYGGTSGRINAIAVSPANPNVVLVGSGTGGIWRSSDGGSTFVPASDNQVDLEVGSLAFAPSDPNIVYAGMGDLGNGYFGHGVLKSLDAGQTWTRVDNGSLGEPGLVSGIGVDPANSNLVYLAQYLSLSGASVFASGFYRSSDGGVSWTRTLYGLPTGLAVDRANPGTIYLAVSQVYSPAGLPAGICKSVDGGNNWKAVLPFAFTRGAAVATVAVAPSNPQTIYAYYGGFNASGLEILFQASTDGGATWSPRDLSAIDSGQFGYNTYIAVDPVAPATVYLGSRDVYESTDGGMTWKNLTLNFVPSGVPGSFAFQPYKATSHADQHAIAFSAVASNRLYIGNDGGIWRSNDAGSTFQSLNSTLSLVQFHSVATHPAELSLTFGGTQDNGSQKQKGPSVQWKEIFGGDGGHCFVDPLDPSILFATYIRGEVHRFTGAGDRFDREIGTNTIFGEPDPLPGGRIAFIAPFTSDGVHDILYFGTWRLFTSHDRGNNWAAPAGFLDLTKGVSRNDGADVLSAIGVGPADPNVIYTGSAQGRAMVSKDGGHTWTDVTGGLPNRHITSIIVSKSDSTVAYITLSGYLAGHVFKTTNAGALWTDISGNLPDIPVNALVVYPSDPDILVVGTDIGIFGSAVGGRQWGPFNIGLPPVIVNDFAVRPNGNILAGTYGRGAYELPAGVKPPPPDFSISFSPPSLTASTGDVITVAVNVNRTGGLSDSVTVTPPDTSSIGIKLKPATPQTGDNVSFRLKIKSRAPTGTEQLTFTGQDSSGAITHAANFVLTIQ